VYAYVYAVFLRIDDAGLERRKKTRNIHILRRARQSAQRRCLRLRLLLVIAVLCTRLATNWRLKNERTGRFYPCNFVLTSSSGETPNGSRLHPSRLRVRKYATAIACGPTRSKKIKIITLKEALSHVRKRKVEITECLAFEWLGTFAHQQNFGLE